MEKGIYHSTKPGRNYQEIPVSDMPPTNGKNNKSQNHAPKQDEELYGLLRFIFRFGATRTRPNQAPKMGIAKRLLTITMLFILLATLSCTATVSAFASVLVAASQIIPVGEVELVWSECELPQNNYPINLIHQQAEECFGQPLPRLAESEKINRTRGVDYDTLQLRIGQDSYRVEKISGYTYGLYRNNTELANLTGMMGSHFANISLVNINGKVAWEFMGFKSFQPQITLFTVVYGQDDVRNLYQIDGAFRPYSMNDKLIFIGTQDDNFFVIYDGVKIGLPFETIHLAHCCEPSAYSVTFGQGRYIFWGIRDGKSYVVEIKQI